MIFYDMPYSAYEEMDGMRPSMLKYGLRSRLHLKRGLNGELKPDPATVGVGNAVHSILARELEDRYRTMPAFEKWEENCTTLGRKSTAKGTIWYDEKVEEWLAENPDVEVLNEIQVATGAKVANKITQHCGDLIKKSQQEVVCTGTIAGLPMKTRLDGLYGRLVWDVKTTTDIADGPFFRQFDKLGYGFSACVHVELLKQNEIYVNEYQIIAAEHGGKSSDYDVRLIEVPFQVWENGLRQVEKVAAQYLESVKTNQWPGLGDGTLKISNWAMTHHDDEEETQ